MSEQLLHKHAQFEFVWRALKELGINKLYVEFDGSGDSGDIENIEVSLPGNDPYNVGENDNHENRATSLALALEQFNNYPLPAGLVGPREHWIPETKSTTLKDLVYELSSHILNYSDAPDWVNNEGGYGTLTWWVEDEEHNAAIEVTYNIRIIEHDVSTFDYNKFGEEDLLDDEAAE